MKIHYICLENREIPNELKGKVRKILNVLRCFLGYFFFPICNSDRQQRQGVGNG